MASKYWIKLYHELLDDPKMGMMPDKLWRRTIEIFLLAGEYDQAGLLPPLDQVAWRLRITKEECNDTLQELQRLEIISRNDDGQYIVTNFAKRQEASTSTERSKHFRQRQGKKPTPSGQNGTGQSQNSDTQAQNNETATKNETPTVLASNENETERCTDTDTDTDTDSISKEIGDSPTPENQSAKKPKKASVPDSPAFKVYTGITNYYSINNHWRSRMAKEVGEQPGDLDRWGQVVEAWTGLGWFQGNVNGMLEYFRRKELPGRNGANSNGHYSNSVRAVKDQSTARRGKFVDPDQAPDWDPFAADSG